MPQPQHYSEERCATWRAYRLRKGPVFPHREDIMAYLKDLTSRPGGGRNVTSADNSEVVGEMQRPGWIRDLAVATRSCMLFSLKGWAELKEAMERKGWAKRNGVHKG